VDSTEQSCTATDCDFTGFKRLRAVLQPNSSLVTGRQSLNVTSTHQVQPLISASDASDSSKAAAISPAITVAPALYTSATGGEAISADTAGGTFTTLTGPVYTEVTTAMWTRARLSQSACGFIFTRLHPYPQF